MRGLYHELLPMRVRLSKTPQFLQEWWWHSARCALVGWVMSTSENPWAVGIPGLLNYWLGPPFSSPIIRWKMMKYAYLTKQTSNQSTTVFQSKVDVNLPLFYWPQRKKKCQSSQVKTEVLYIAVAPADYLRLCGGVCSICQGHQFGKRHFWHYGHLG